MAQWRCNYQAQVDRGNHNLGAAAVGKEVERWALAVEPEQENHMEPAAVASRCCSHLCSRTGWDWVLDSHMGLEVQVRDKVQEQRQVEGSHCNWEPHLLQQGEDQPGQGGSAVWT